MSSNNAPLYALIDCNNFYASCERVFQPKLKGQAVIVLSNNDGCVIARSNEAKKLGIEMGVPFFKIRPLIKDYPVHIRSSNYELYGDMSRRVMLTLAQLTSDVEIYSIDEAFCDLSGFRHRDLAAYAHEIRDTVRQWTGIPVSIGIGPTKTLAKAANQIAKKADGVLVMDNEGTRRALLALLAPGDVWGVGRQYAKMLAAHGVRTALELADQPDGWVRSKMNVTGLRTVHELRGIPCIQTEDEFASKQSITTSRMFGRPITTLDELLEAITTYTMRAAEKLRTENRQARHIDIFFYSSPHKQPFYSGKAAYDLPMATNYTPELIRYAVRGVKSAFRPGVSYIKAGLMLSDLTAPDEQQLNLLVEPDTESQSSLMTVLDNVNQRWGKNSLFYAGAGSRMDRRWSMKREHRSRSYTTRLDEILIVKS